MLTLRQISVKIKPITSCRRKVSHAILVGGGVGGKTVRRLYEKQLPEYSEYVDLMNVKRAMDKSRQFRSISVLYGNGSTKAIHYAGIIGILTAKIDNVERYINIRPFKNKATIKDLDISFDKVNKVLKDGDNLWIYISGHGGQYSGTVLWNEYWTINMITPQYIKEKISSIDKNVKIKIFVDSCYSGSFLSIGVQMPDRDICVVSSADTNNGSYYMPDGSIQTQELFLNHDIVRKGSERYSYSIL